MGMMSKSQNEICEGSAATSVSGSEIVAVLNRICDRIESIERQLAGNLKDWLTVAEFGSLTSRSDYTVRRWVAEGRIRATRVTGTGPKGRLMISRDQLSNLLADGR